ncbi:HD domain-containing protein (plasmid) [Trichlorobacter lovleyi]|uniref:HD domain-containing protein n=1 Tax=Trichlorobacter lovleyi TaxID=313985 RepID=UPI00223F0571|nr:HD domain-containing protein [Trichlorobacter lovleyi]QOX80890.1 HD domain-containing protein [Trichlorobacter lovleyi]
MDSFRKVLERFVNKDKKDEATSGAALPHGFSAAINRKKNEYAVALPQLVPGLPVFSDKPTSEEIAIARGVIAKAVEDGELTPEARRALIQFCLIAGLNTYELLPVKEIKGQPAWAQILSFEDALSWLDNNQTDVIKAVRTHTEHIRLFTLSDADILNDARIVAEDAFKQFKADCKETVMTIPRFDYLFLKMWAEYVWHVYLQNFENSYKGGQLRVVSGGFIEPGIKLFWDTYVSNKPALREYRQSIRRILKELDLHTSCSSVAPFTEKKAGVSSEVYSALATVPLWKHSLGVAEMAMLHAKQFKVAMGDAVVAALAHDIGKLPYKDDFLEEGENPLSIGHAKMSGIRFGKIGVWFKSYRKVWEGIDEHHNVNPVTPIGKLLAFCNTAARQNELAEINRSFLANTNPNIKLRCAEIKAGGTFEQFAKSLYCPISTEDIEQIKQAVKEFRATWQPDGKKPSLAQTYQMVAKTLGFKTWEAMVAVAGRNGSA